MTALRTAAARVALEVCAESSFPPECNSVFSNTHDVKLTTHNSAGVFDVLNFIHIRVHYYIELLRLALPANKQFVFSEIATILGYNNEDLILLKKRILFPALWNTHVTAEQLLRIVVTVMLTVSQDTTSQQNMLMHVNIPAIKEAFRIQDLESIPELDDNQKLEVLEKVLILRIKTCPDFIRILLETGNAEISQRFDGTQHGGFLGVNLGRGNNMYGKFLVELRSYLQTAKQEARSLLELTLNRCMENGMPLGGFEEDEEDSDQEEFVHYEGDIENENAMNCK